MAPLSIALMTHATPSLIQSGMVQNAAFLVHVLRQMGHVVALYYFGDKPIEFAGGGLGAGFAVQPLTADARGAEHLAATHDVVLWATIMATREVAAFLTARGTRSIGFECGTSYRYNLLEFATHDAPAPNWHPLSQAMHGELDDEVWVIPSMAGSQASYQRAIAGGNTPVKIVPHAWSAEILAADAALGELHRAGADPVRRAAAAALCAAPWRETASTSAEAADAGAARLPPHLVALQRTPPPSLLDWGTAPRPADGSLGMLVLIMESNVTDSKTAQLPLWAVETLFRRDPSAIHRVLVYSDKLPNPEYFAELLDALDVRPRVEVVSRIHFVDAARGHATLERPVVLLSHQMAHPLNYLWYDSAYCGIQFVHNSPILAAAGIGVAYNGQDIDGAATALLRAAADDARTAVTRRAKARAWLWENCSPRSPSVQRGFAEALADCAPRAVAR